ncbi:MAG: FecR domain-containing protein [Pseudomonadota bacterium]
MNDAEQERLLDEAATIFLQLRQNPDEIALIGERDAFLARGQAERRAYRTIVKAWSGAAPKRRSSKLASIALLAAGLGLAAVFGPSLHTAWRADFATGTEPDRVVLASGDGAELDADTALIDATDGSSRVVELLEGAAFFSVETDRRPFAVTIGPVTAEALGTAFETAHIDGEIMVAVAEGVVAVRNQAQSWQIEAGERLLWSEGEGARIEEVSAQSIASWRTDRLLALGMTFAEVADVIDRRLPGRVVILEPSLGASRVTGGFDLRDPASALRALAASRDAEVIAAPPLGAVIFSRN